ncbi:CSC1-like protein RXW8 isoform X1 [Chenopodium quinoa]|uniref:CSC1-like protein RXW8 isoform X1 n=1 Tax=Chenopodium quinoa TaxID=63459 RepID=UPI000B785CB6|nr:CSC1-like protein RXW8 isoform X1 [Chenopodium quinoa]
MEISALLTSAGINIGICCVLFSLYSILRKQPSNRNVYFGRKLAQMRSKRSDPHWFERFVPSPSWIVKAWETSEDVILAAGGLDAVVFMRMLVFSIRIFSIAAIVCTAIVLPLNYYGEEMQHKLIPAESLEVFTTQNVKEGSRWLWAHCLALYIISCSACILLYFENKSIIKRRLAYIKGSSQDLSQFAVLVRGIPWSAEESYSTSLKNYFTKHYPSSYLSHQMVYHCGKIEKLMKNVREMYDVLYHDSIPSCHSCGLSGGGRPNVFNILVNEPEIIEKGRLDLQDLRDRGKPMLDYEELFSLGILSKECPSAFVFFKTRYAAACAAQAHQSSNPMLWVTNLAPEPRDVYWPNLAIPYRQFWLRRTATLLATAAFLVFFIAPVTLVQSLANLTQLQQAFPFLKGLLKKPYVSQLVTGYLPSVILVLFFYTVPPLMILFSTIEGSISRSGRKRGACCKVLFFTIWNVFFVNIASGTVLNKLNVFSQPKDIPTQLAAGAVPAAVKFFMTYVLTSGWTSLACEVVQLWPLLCNFIYKFILRKNHGPFDGEYTFPYHSEAPRVLLFGLLGLNFAILAPLMLPLLLIYFCLAYLVYKNQILNVYITDYDSGGKYWPIVQTSTIFSLVMAQIIAMGVFALKKSPVCLGFTIPLAICTLLFNEYCRRRFLPVFKNIASEVLIDLDQQDEENGRMEAIYQRLQSAYCQLEWLAYGSSRPKTKYLCNDEDIRHTQELKSEIEFSQEITSDESVDRPRPANHKTDVESSPIR